MSGIKCLVFDFDGVLVDSNAVKRRAYFDIFAHLGDTHALVEKSLLEKQDGDRYQVIEYIIKKLKAVGVFDSDRGMSELIMQFAIKYNDICEAYASTCREIAGASVCLSRLAEQYSLYINSATPEEPLRRIVQRRFWLRYFQEVLGRPRSKIENIKRVMEREKVDGSAIIFVGDAQRDLAAAGACGCHFVGIRNAYNDFDPQGLILLDDLYGLEELIRQQWGGR